MTTGIESGRRRALGFLVGNKKASSLRGITSVCSAHPLVIEAALRRGCADDVPVLVEATCNQVNHEGGYTGMVPADFRAFVERIASDVGFPTARLILGGDHLGPNPWKSLPAEEALARAEQMIAAYVAAGFTKIHLDTSMGCAGEPAALADELTAKRAARLGAVAEKEAARIGANLVYIIGTEVPPPGGATHVLSQIEPTEPAAVERTLGVHRAAFASAGIADALERVIGVVVQPGVEFGNANVAIYKPERARALSAVLAHMPGLVFEAHSTDYQPAEALSSLVDDGFAILKVGPGLTFALREALYGLSAIAVELSLLQDAEALPVVMERVMRERPVHWTSHYPGTLTEQHLQRHFSYSDRIRYYWPEKDATEAVVRLFAVLEGHRIPETLISQHLARLYPDVAMGKLASEPRALCLAAIDRSLVPYALATTVAGEA